MSVPAGDCTTPQSETHGTKLEVLYRWHPWFGRQVTVEKSIGAVFRCRLLDDPASRLREVPQWMFDRGTCCTLQALAEPHVSVDALRRLSRLLTGEASMLEGQHFRSIEGDADDQSPPSRGGSNAAKPVSAPPDHTGVEESSSQDSPAS